MAPCWWRTALQIPALQGGQTEYRRHSQSSKKIRPAGQLGFLVRGSASEGDRPVLTFPNQLLVMAELECQISNSGLLVKDHLKIFSYIENCPEGGLIIVDVVNLYPWVEWNETEPETRHHYDIPSLEGNVSCRTRFFSYAPSTSTATYHFEEGPHFPVPHHPCLHNSRFGDDVGLLSIVSLLIQAAKPLSTSVVDTAA